MAEKQTTLPPSLKDITEGLTGKDEFENQGSEGKDPKNDDPKKDSDPDPKKDTDPKKDPENLDKDKKDADKGDGGNQGDENGDDGDPDNKDDDKGDEGKGNETIWGEVEKITGKKVEVDFGDVDPETAEGAAKYAKAYAETEVADFEDQLAKMFPREYKALQLAMEGLDPSILYKEKEETSYKDFQLDDKNPEQHKELYNTVLKLRGVPDDEREALIKVAEDTGKLIEKGKSALTDLQKRQEESDKKKQAEIDQKIEIKRSKATNVINDINQVINKGDGISILIPDSEKKALVNRLGEVIHIEEDGKAYIVREITPETLANEIQGEYFKMKNGDLKNLVERKAKTENARKFKKAVEGEKKKITGEGGGAKKNLSLKDL